MSHKLVVLNEGTLVKEELDTLTRRQLVVRVLLINTGLTTAHECLLLDAVESLRESLSLKRGEGLELRHGHRSHHGHSGSSETQGRSGFKRLCKSREECGTSQCCLHFDSNDIFS